MNGRVELLPVAGLPEVTAGADLAALIAAAAELRDGDVVVVAQKIVSKAEGAFVEPAPGEDRDAARRRVAYEQAVRVVADTPHALIVETAHGLVCANAGVDASNVPGGRLCLLPADPDASARRLRDDLRARTGADVAVVVADSFGRPWRVGQTDVAIGVAGLAPLRDERGGVDREGTTLTVTEVAIADQLAAAADLVRRKADGIPAVVVRGVRYTADEDANARRLVRTPDLDLFPRGRGMLVSALLDAPEPSAGHASVTAEELQSLRRLAPDLTVAASGPPTRLYVADPVAGALVAAALVDLGHAVRWSRTHDGGLDVAAGRPQERR